MIEQQGMRRMLRALRDTAYRGLTVVERIIRPRGHDILPPAHLRLYYYRTLNPERFRRACDDARTELMIQGLRPEHRVLDIGSGIGNLAIGLLDYSQGGYDGVDVHREAVTWCQQAITTRHPQFRFHHADLASRAYNAGASASASTYRFPFDDHSFEFVLVSSVFTHLPPDAVQHYVSEISRVLKRNGVCVASYFLLNDASRRGILAHESFMSFDVEHPSGLCRLHSQSVPEAAVALDEAFVRRVHEDAGLHVRDLRRGRWWRGEAHDQDVLTVASIE